ncbi:MAG: mannosyltransferase family protein [Ktedonobacteraceae bacterium]
MDTMDTNVQPNNVDEHQYISSLTQETPARPTSAGSSPADIIIPHIPLPNDIFAGQSGRRTRWTHWYTALKNVVPVYIATHLAFFVISCLSVLFVLKDFSWQALPTYTLWHSWNRWDSGIFTTIAKYGYTNYDRTAFFPLYPMLERALMYVTHNDPFIAGLVISDLAGLGIFVVLYRLVKDDFSAELAERTVLYLAIFPTAFYLASGYNESLFIFLSLMSFYQLRRGHWWLAGIFGLLASLTRSAGLLMLIPFCYEYLRQHTFQWKAIRWDVLAGTLIPAGIALFGVWCFIQYHDFLAFSHAQVAWNRSLAFPGYGILISIQDIQKSQGFLSFQSLRNLTDLAPDLFILLFILLGFVGPWRFPRQMWGYGLYASILYIFLQLFPNGGTGLFPLESVGRFMLEIFPAFIVLAAIGKYKTFHMSYLMVSAAVLFFLLTQFLTGHWVL